MSKAVKTLLNFFKSIESKTNLMDNGAIQFEIEVPDIDYIELLNYLGDELEVEGSKKEFLENIEKDSESRIFEGFAIIHHLEDPNTFVVTLTINLPLKTLPAIRIEVMKFIAMMGCRLYWPTLMYSELTDSILCRCSTYATEKTFNDEVLSELISCLFSSMEISSYGLLKIYKGMNDAETAIKEVDLYLRNVNVMQDFNQNDE